jgi:hypothetical protein
MAFDRFPKPPVRFVADALVGLTVFSVATIAVLGPLAAAQMVQIDGIFTAAPVSLTMGAANGFSQSSFMGVPLAVRNWSGTNDPQTIVMILAGAFSLLFALNLAFVRHVRQAHAVETVSADFPEQVDETRIH